MSEPKLKPNSVSLKGKVLHPNALCLSQIKGEQSPRRAGFLEAYTAAHHRALARFPEGWLALASLEITGAPQTLSVIIVTLDFKKNQI